MKKILLLTVTFLMTVSIAFADMMIAPETLPANIQQFVQTNFPNANIIYAERDRKSFEIKLNTGAEVEFYANGDWKEIKSYQNFPLSVLPQPVVDAVKNTHPQAFIIKAEKTWNGFEIKTSNMMEIYITASGQIMGQKFDN